MSKEEIVRFAESIREKYKTNNAVSIAHTLGINISYTSINPTTIPVYILKPNPSDQATIVINSHFTTISQIVLCAHELGHALLHREYINHFSSDAINNVQELEANLFAVALLFHKEDFLMNITAMDNYLLKGILDANISYSI